MKKILSLVIGKAFFAIAILFVFSCSSMQPPSNVALNDQTILILSPQGVEPSKDTVGFNDLSRRVTQAFSAALAPKLKYLGKTAINVIDQGTKYDLGQKLAIYSVKERAGKTIVLTLETSDVFGDKRLNLRVQWIDQRPVVNNSLLRGISVASKVERSYVLRGSKSGDSLKSMDDIASEFIGAMKAEGKL